jgi:tetratricopeptide (TPR) repeat protein
MVDQVDSVLLALAGQIESGYCPSLIIIDDLDISPSAHRVYRDSLALVLHRACSSGRGILLTARGGTSDSAIVQDFNDIELLEVPELSSDETETLCIEHGCPHEIAKYWSTLITAWTRGHPKLVQVRLAEIAARNWPRPNATDLVTQSSAVTSVHQMARQLLSDSVPGPIAEFVYMVSECSILMHRSIAIRLAEAVEGLTNGGDVLDNLTGKWLELVEGQWFRTTALLSGVAIDVWSPEKRKWAHICLHDAILAKHTLDSFEAAALLFHAYIGGEPRRLAQTAIRLQLIDGKDAKCEVERQLLWLPFVALETGQSITDDAMAGAILRGLQFRVALTLNTECLPQICARWEDDIERIQHPMAKAISHAMMWHSASFTDNSKIPLKFRLEAIMGIPTLPREILDAHSNLGIQFFENANAEDGMPKGGTITQVIFLYASRSIRELSNLDELLHWLDNVATEDIRQQFDAMLEWPLVQSLGAFVHSAWATAHEQIKDWNPWIELFERIEEYAKRRASPRFGREAAKARAIILTEYLKRSEEALSVLEQAEMAFGPSVVLMEQRANVLFHAQDDKSVLEIWDQLTNDPVSRTTLDPFAYRRAGISAARLKQWDKAGQIFLNAANSVQPGSFALTKFGLQVDAALAISLTGDQAIAARLLAEAVLLLPAEAAVEDDERWEAVQRAAFAVYRTIENSLWKTTQIEPQFEPGYASSPDLKVSKIEPGQVARSEITRAQILHLVSTLEKEPAGIAQELEVLETSRYFVVRWFAIEAKLALAYSTGAGAGFIETLLAFDRATAELSVNMQQGLTLLDQDDVPKSSFPIAPESWFGLLCAGVICTGADLLAHLKLWLDVSNQLLGEEAVLTNNIRLLLKGASLPADLLQPATIDTASPSTMRCGAAARLLQGMLPPEKTLQFQAFLTSGLMSDKSVARQVLFNRHVARCFAGSWRRHAQNRFQFYSPSISVPALLKTIDGVDSGRSTLKTLLVAAAEALRHPLGEFMERVL